jgi:RNA polymerase sigma factor (sigma-70 family)
MDKTDRSADALLVTDFLKGKVEAFDILYDRYSRRLYIFALMLLKNKEDARDVVQETFLRIWQKRKELSVDKSFKSFLFTVTYNIMVDQVRKRLNDEKYQAFLIQQFKFESPLDR